MYQSQPHINDFSPEVLLGIFTNLPFIDKVRLSTCCKHWKGFRESYDLFKTQTSLGCFPLPAVRETDPYRCNDAYHIIKPDDCALFSLFHASRQVKVDPSNEVQELPQRLIADVYVLDKCLDLCGRYLKVLGLNFCYSVGARVIRLIGKHCTGLEHLDLSFSSASPFIEKKGREEEMRVILANDCWLDLANSVRNTLKHLNVTCFSGITDEALMIMFKMCEKLEDISISCSIYGDIKGYCLSDAPKNVKKVTLFVHYDDKTTNVNIAVLALKSLAKSEARESLRSLRVLQNLRRDTVNEIATNFPNLDYLHIGDNVFWISDPRFIKASAFIGKMKNLSHLSLKVPESFKFDVSFASIVNTCTNLKTLHIYGGRVCDTDLPLLPISIPNLESLVLSYSTQEEPRITDIAFSSIAQLSLLKELTLNGVAITDSGIEQFCENFTGEASQIVSLDVRKCSRLTLKTLNTCIEFSKQRTGRTRIPLTLLIDPFCRYQSNPAVIPKTIRVLHTSFVNELGLRNEYFAPKIERELIGDKFISFGKCALEEIAAKYLSDFFK